MTTEKTFSKYNPAQASNYARNRLNYHHTLYDTLITYHKETGGQFSTLVDLGCGPGTAAGSLSSHFTEVIGLDPSEGMIATARSLNEDNKNIRFEVSTAEQLGANLSPPLEPGSVDLITAANAAHWFDMPAFWVSAAKVLKPGGTVALWTSGATKIHPSMPNAVAMQAALDEIEKRELEPFFEPGNYLTRSGYVGLPLPWTGSEETYQGDFDKDSFFRKDWDIAEENFFIGQGVEVNLDTFEKMLGTGSPVERWRQAHPELVGTEGDIIRKLRRVIERFLREAGVEEGKERLRGAVPGVLLMVKRK